MFALSVPELAGRLAGLVLVSAAPHAGWREAFAAYAAAHPLPEVAAAAVRYAAEPGDAALRDLTLAAAPWNAEAAALPELRPLLAGLPYCDAAVRWADEHFDPVYRARWTPAGIPVLIVSGALDHVVDQGLWAGEPGFGRANVTRRVVPGAGHWPWLESPDAVRAAFADMTDRLESAG